MCVYRPWRRRFALLLIKCNERWNVNSKRWQNVLSWCCCSVCVTTRTLVVECSRTVLVGKLRCEKDAGKLPGNQRNAPTFALVIFQYRNPTKYFIQTEYFIKRPVWNILWSFIWIIIDNYSHDFNACTCIVIHTIIMLFFAVLLNCQSKTTSFRLQKPYDYENSDKSSLR